MHKRSPGTSQRKLFGLLPLVLVLLACGISTFNSSSNPSPQFKQHIIVSLTDPVSGEAYPISAGLSVRAEAISDSSIARMELWVDGTLYEEYAAPEDGLGLLIHYWTWSPKTLEAHTLMVRAYNDQNQTAFSNVIHIKGIEDPGYILAAKAEEGDTVSGIAEKYNVPLAEVLVDNPGLTGIASLSAGEEVFVHIGTPVTASAPSTTARALMSLNQWSLGSQRDLLSPQVAPSAPSLAVSGQGCAATLAVSDLSENEMGFNIYRLNPGAISFSKLTTLPAHAGSGILTHQDSTLYGLYHYYVAAFDDSDESASNLVSLSITDPNCAGEPATVESLTSIPSGVEAYYLYASVNKGNWRRFPADEFTYLKKSDGIDFNQVASSLAPNLAGNISMRGEVWGMVNGTAILLGNFDKTFKAAQPPAVLEPSSLYHSMQTILEVRGSFDVSAGHYFWHNKWGMQYDTHVFRFGTDTNAAYGIWQVSSVPFQPEASFNPACLLLAGKANGSGTPNAPFDFSIDFSSLKPKIESVQLSLFENSMSQTPVFSMPYSPEKMDASGQQMVTEPKWGAGAFGLGGNPVQANFDPCAQNVSAEGIVTYHVRIIPMSNGQSTGKPSNSVAMIYDPNGDLKITFPAPPPIPDKTYYDVKILKFTDVHVPDLTFVYCVEIVENPFYNSGALTQWSDLKPGDRPCPKKFSGLGKPGILDPIEDAFNYIGGLYNKLSDWATELVDQLNILCQGAKLTSQAVNSGQEEVKDACHFAAKLAIAAAKTYVGLPPSFPEFDQLTDVGKQNLVELAAQEMEAQGVPCPEDCKKVISAGIDYSLDQVKESMSNSSCVGKQEANDRGFEPLCFPAEIITKPDPRGQPAPAMVEVQVTRRQNTIGAEFPEPKSCNINISASAANSSHIGESYISDAGFQWQGAPIEGNLLDGTGGFPTLQPGQPTNFLIVLQPQSFWLPGHQQFVQNGWKPEHFDDWYILYKGANANIEAEGLCKFEFPEGVGFSHVAINGDSRQEGPLGDAWKQTCHPYNCP